MHLVFVAGGTDDKGNLGVIDSRIVPQLLLHDEGQIV